MIFRKKDNHPRAELERLAEKLPIGQRVGQGEAMSLMGRSDVGPQNFSAAQSLLRSLESSGLIRRFGLNLERVAPFPPRIPSKKGSIPSWEAGDPAPDPVMYTVASGPHAGESFPYGEIEERMAGWRREGESQRLSKLKSELAELGVTAQ